MDTTTTQTVRRPGAPFQDLASLLRDAARQSSWLLFVAGVALAYVLAIVAYARLMHLVVSSFPPIGS